MFKKIIIRKVCVALISLFNITAPLFSQFFNTGSAPFSANYKQINTRNFKIIFPAENYHTACDLTSYLSKTFSVNQMWYDSVKSKPVKIILYNQSVLSNGYVTLAPRRMELITTPSQDSYSQPWIEQLALHEYRHVIQLNTLNQGFTRGISYLFGEIAPGGMSAFLPLWYLEGDAVFAETVLSQTGRGREPGFNKELRAIEFQRMKRFSYDQAYLGSYKYFTPDYYRVGYQMVKYAYLKYGSDVFNKTVKNVANKPYTIAPFYFGLKKNTGLSKTQLYNSTLNYLSEYWDKENNYNSNKRYNDKTIKTQFKSNYVNYRFPYIDNNDTILALRTSIDDVARLVKIKNGAEKNLVTIGRFIGNQIGYSNRYIVWEEINSSLRWEQKNYSVIRIFDRILKESQVLKKRARHFTPSINKNGTKLAVIHVDSANLSYVETYNIHGKEFNKRYIHPDSSQLSYNCWVNDSLLAVVSLNAEGKSIYTLDLNTQNWKKIYGPTFYNISSLNASENSLIFTYTIDGKQNIYQYNFNNNLIIRLTNSSISADYGYLSGNKLVYSDYSINGNKIKVLSKNRFDSTGYESIKFYKYTFIDSISGHLKVTNKFESKDTKNYQAKHYSRLLNALNYHSWILPFYVDVLNSASTPDLQDLYNNTNIGFNIFSQNILSTFTSSIGYYFRDGSHHFRPVLYYTGIFPKISLEMDIGGNAFVISENDSLVNLLPGKNRRKEIITNVDLPFNFSKSRYIMSLHAGLSMRYNNIYIASSSKYDEYNLTDSVSNTYFYNGLARLTYYLNYYTYSHKSLKDIYPRWGINLYLSYLNALPTIPYHSLWESNVFIGTAYSPGIIRHHSLRFRFSNEYGLAERISRRNLPRGYEIFNYNFSHHTQKYSVDYSFPLLYPDLSFGPFAYLKRIHATLFYDFMRYKASEDLNENTGKVIGNLYSYGTEICFETHFLRFFIPFTPTFRYSYLPKRNDFNFIFYINSSISF
jgi:hypothetical protein